MKKVFLFVSIIIFGFNKKADASSDSMLKSILNNQLIDSGYNHKIEYSGPNVVEYFANILLATIFNSVNQLIIPSGNSQEYNNCQLTNMTTDNCSEKCIDCTTQKNFSRCAPCQAPGIKAKFTNLQQKTYEYYALAMAIFLAYTNYIVPKNPAQIKSFHENYRAFYNSLFPQTKEQAESSFFTLSSPHYSMTFYMGFQEVNPVMQSWNLLSKLLTSRDLQNIFNVTNCNRNLFNSSNQECTTSLSYNSDGSVDFAATMQACQQQSNKCETWNNNMLNSTYTSKSDMLKEAESLSFLYNALKMAIDRKDNNAINNLTEIYQSQSNNLTGTLNGAGIVLAYNYALKQKNYSAIKIIMQNTINYLSQIMTISHETYLWLGQRQLNNSPTTLRPIDTF